jgi:hypothetical protein
MVRPVTNDSWLHFPPGVQFKYELLRFVKGAALLIALSVVILVAGVSVYSELSSTGFAYKRSASCQTCVSCDWKRQVGF